ncbi:Uncharacterized protein dnm_053130 [Desulfonema magnum]|uniref:Uncharacterized protein n=1 Tax=Desulfonema magnum TaxID=45655 RepID=A0A975GQS5_9BACT|nr:Uncharacterized protein dnm_053130 [Desulfonema magnum]
MLTKDPEMEGIETETLPSLKEKKKLTKDPEMRFLGYYIRERDERLFS